MELVIVEGAGAEAKERAESAAAVPMVAVPVLMAVL